MSEEWRAVVGFEGVYEINDVGGVRRVAGSPRCKRARPVKASVRGPGYLVVQLWKDNRHYLRTVHRLVAEAFLGPATAETVNHKDGNKLNNEPANLEYLSLAGNTRHGFASGLIPRKPVRFAPVALTCAACSQIFVVKGMRFRARVKETGAPPKFCSSACYHAAPRGDETREKISIANKRAWANGRR